MITPDRRRASSGSASEMTGAAVSACVARPGEIHGRLGTGRCGLMSVQYAWESSGCPSASGITAISRMASSCRSWAPVPSRSRAARLACCQGVLLPVMATFSGRRVSVIIQPHLDGEALPQSLGPDVAVFDEVVAGVAEAVEQVLERRPQYRHLLLRIPAGHR